MAAILTNTTTTNNYKDTQLGMSGFYADGSLTIANNPVSVLLWKKTKDGSLTSIEYTYVSPNAIPLIAGDREWLYGLQIKSAIAGSPAQVFGWLQEPGTAGFSPGTPFTQSVAANGSVTPGQTIMTVGGRIGANGAVLGGTGFSVVHNGTGDYTITFSPAFPNIPTVVITPSGQVAGSVRFATSATATVNSIEVFTYVLAGNAADVIFDFIATDPGS